MRTPAFHYRGLAFGLEDMVLSRGSRRRSRHNAYLFARERMERRHSYQGMSPFDGAQRGSLQIRSPIEAAPCRTQTRQPLSIEVGRRFLVFRYQTAIGYVVPADGVA